MKKKIEDIKKKAVELIIDSAIKNGYADSRLLNNLWQSILIAEKSADNKNVTDNN